MDYTLKYLIEHRIPLTLENYLALAYMGDVESLEQLGPEDYVEIQALLDEAQLVDTKSRGVN